MHFSKATLLAILAATAEARTFAVLRFNGNGPLTTGRMDPIVNPGVASGHSHAIQGGNAFALEMTDDQPFKSTCTTAKIKNDNSNYWTPSLWFKDPKTGKLTSVDFFYMNVYYFFENDQEKVHAFPPGLRMFVGDPNARAPPKSPTNILDKSQGTPMPIQWTCPRGDATKGQPLYPPGSDGLHGVGIQDPNNAGQGVGFPDKECDGYASPLRADIHFPSCYNPAKGLRNYKENMEWPTNGKCPPGFLHVPHLFYEVYWDTLKFKGQWTPGKGDSPWVLSNGDPTGYSLHGDFISGWETKTLQTIIDTCDAGSAGMDKCPSIPGGLNPDSTTCNIKNLIPEAVTGTMDKLPGGNAIGEWGVNGSGGGGGGGSAPAYTAPVASSTKAAVSTKNNAAVTTTKASGGSGGGSPPAASASASKSPAKPAASPSSKPGNGQAPGGGNPVSPIKVPTKAPAPTAAPGSGSGGSNTLVTSYVAETTVVWTTVTMPAPSSAPQSGSGTSNVASGWSYKGCFSDERYERVLSGIEFANVGHKQVTNTKCVAYCEARGFTIAGTEFGGQCFCGNELKGSKSVGEDKCAMPCEGDGKQTCGGGLTLSVYEKKKGGKVKARRGQHLHRHINGHSI